MRIQPHKRRYQSEPLPTVVEDDESSSGTPREAIRFDEYRALPKRSTLRLPDVGSSSKLPSLGEQTTVEETPIDDVPPDSPITSKQQPLMDHFRDDGSDLTELEAFRKAVLADLGPSVPEISVETFLQEFLPRLNPPLDVEKVIQILMDGTTPVLATNGWTAFSELYRRSSFSASADYAGSSVFTGLAAPSAPPLFSAPSASTALSTPTAAPTTSPPKSPPKNTNHEDHIYSPFETIVNTVIDNARLPQKKCVLFKQRPHESPAWQFKSFSGKPDGYGVYIPPEGAPDSKKSFWHEMVFVAEYKKKDRVTGHTDNNIKKICGSMAQIMRDDPTRRFTFGITLERFNMRMWYCDRSQVVVSETFHIMENYTPLIRFILSLAYADSPWDLGFDTTMSPTIVEGTSQYDITVHSQHGPPRCFRTLELIDSHGAQAVRGRATRVWKAIELLEDGTVCGSPVALKDSWVDSDRKNEGTIMEEILESLSNPADRKAVQKRILTVRCHGYVKGPDLTHTDETRSVASDIRRFVLRSQDRSVTVTPVESGASKNSRSPSETSARSKRSNASRTSSARSKPAVRRPTTVQNIIYGKKVHYRIVFEEVGVPITEVRSMPHAFVALRHAANVLYYLHSAGWIHRDVSAYNVLWVEGQDSGKLVDLEYAMKVAGKRSNAVHAVRTATDLFMSPEVIFNRYRFNVHSAQSASVRTPQRRDSDEGLISNNPYKFEEHYLAEYRAANTASSSSTPVSSTPSTSSSAAASPCFCHNELHDWESLLWIAVYLLLFRGVEPDAQQQINRDQCRAASDLFGDTNTRNAVMMTDGEYMNRFVARMQPQLLEPGKQLETLRKELHHAFLDAETDRSPGRIRPSSQHLSVLWKVFRSEFLNIAQNAGGLFLALHTPIFKLHHPKELYESTPTGSAKTAVSTSNTAGSITQGTQDISFDSDPPKKLPRKGREEGRGRG